MQLCMFRASAINNILSGGEKPALRIVSSWHAGVAEQRRKQSQVAKRCFSKTFVLKAFVLMLLSDHREN